MATALTLVRRALRLATIIASGEAPDSAVVQDALSVLNSMLAEWHDAGIGVPDYSIPSEAAPLSMGDGDVEAVAQQLAIRICPEYGQEPSMVLVALASESMGRLRSKYFQPGKSDLSELPLPTGCVGGWDLERG